MKRILTVIICAVLVFAFSGCTNKEEDIESVLSTIEYSNPSEISDSDREIFERVKDAEELNNAINTLFDDAINNAKNADTEYDKSKITGAIISHSASMDALGIYDKNTKSKLDNYYLTLFNKTDIDSIFEFMDLISDALGTYEFKYYSNPSNLVSTSDIENILSSKYSVAISQKNAGGYYDTHTEIDAKTKAIENNHLTGSYQWSSSTEYCGDFCYQKYKYQAPRYGNETYETNAMLSKYDGSGDYLLYKGETALGGEKVFDAISDGGTAYVSKETKVFDVIVKINNTTYTNGIYTISIK